MNNIKDGQTFSTIINGKLIHYLHVKGEMYELCKTYDITLTEDDVNLILEWYDDYCSLKLTNQEVLNVESSQLADRLGKLIQLNI